MSNQTCPAIFYSLGAISDPEQLRFALDNEPRRARRGAISRQTLETLDRGTDWCDRNSSLNLARIRKTRAPERNIFFFDLGRAGWMQRSVIFHDHDEGAL
jgi:hypothetical protein